MPLNPLRPGAGGSGSAAADGNGDGGQSGGRGEGTTASRAADDVGPSITFFGDLQGKLVTALPLFCPSFASGPKLDLPHLRKGSVHTQIDNSTQK